MHNSGNSLDGTVQAAFYSGGANFQTYTFWEFRDQLYTCSGCLRLESGESPCHVCQPELVSKPCPRRVAEMAVLLQASSTQGAASTPAATPPPTTFSTLPVQPFSLSLVRALVGELCALYILSHCLAVRRCRYLNILRCILGILDVRSRCGQDSIAPPLAGCKLRKQPIVGLGCPLARADQQ